MELEKKEMLCHVVKTSGLQHRQRGLNQYLIKTNKGTKQQEKTHFFSFSKMQMIEIKISITVLQKKHIQNLKQTNQ